MINTDTYDYARDAYLWKRHHERFVARVKAHGLPCQSCCGSGGHVEVELDDGTGPWLNCGWCEGTGYVTSGLRGLYLRTMRAEKRKRSNHT